MASSDEELLRVLRAPCEALGVELDDVELHAGILQVTIDKVGGLDLESLSQVSRAVSVFLDEHEEIAPEGRYELEVSTPGVERRLRRPEQFQRVTGERVALRTQPGSAGERRAEGILLSADEDGILLEVEGGQRRLAYREIERARTVFDWQAELSARRATEKRASEGAASGVAAAEVAGPAGKRTRSPASAPAAKGRRDGQAGGEKKHTRERAARS